MRRRRGWLALVVALLGSAALVGAVVVVWRAREIERRQRGETFLGLEELASLVALARSQDLKALPRADGTGGDPSGMDAYWRAINDGLGMFGYLARTDDGRHFVGRYNGHELSAPLVDSWGHPFVYRCPGHVHTHGWDLYSLGPNYEDDHGEGDDILVGEDVASFGSGS